MKEIHNKILTSNKYVNKLLLSNPQLDTRISYIRNGKQVFYYSHPKFFEILQYEVSQHWLSQKEFESILFDYYKLPEKLDQFTEDQKLILIDLGYCLNELKDDRSDVVRERLAINGHFLDEYTYDSSVDVRKAVAAHAHNAHILINDENEEVSNIARYALLEQKSMK